MEVVIVSPTDIESNKHGGTKSYVLNLITSLVKEDIKTTLIGISYSSRIPKGIVFDFIPVVKDIKISGFIFLFHLFLKTPFIKFSDNTLIHAQRPDSLFPFIIFHPKIPKIITLHGIPNQSALFKKGRAIHYIYNSLEKYSFKYVNKIIAVNEGTKEYYLKKYPWLKHKICVIPVGIDTKVFKPLDKSGLRLKFALKNTEKIILYVGRLEKEKQLDFLLKSFKEIEKESQNYKLLMVGDGRERKKLENLTRELGLNNVVFLGKLAHNKIPEIINCSDVLVLVSLYEGCPTVILEALACGIPVISTDVGNVKEVIGGSKAGCIIHDTTNQNELKDNIRDIIINKSNLREVCLKRIEAYSWDILIKRILNVYNKVLQKE